MLKYIAADERSGNGDPGEADLELWIVTDYVEKGTTHFLSLVRDVQFEMLHSDACCTLECPHSRSIVALCNPSIGWASFASSKKNKLRLKSFLTLHF